MLGSLQFHKIFEIVDGMVHKCTYIKTLSHFNRTTTSNIIFKQYFYIILGINGFIFT